MYIFSSRFIRINLLLMIIGRYSISSKLNVYTFKCKYQLFCPITSGQKFCPLVNHDRHYVTDKCGHGIVIGKSKQNWVAFRIRGKSILSCRCIPEPLSLFYYNADPSAYIKPSLRFLY